VNGHPSQYYAGSTTSNFLSDRTDRRHRTVSSAHGRQLQASYIGKTLHLCYQWCSRGGTPFPHMISGQGERRYSRVPPNRLAKKCKVYGKLILRKIIEIVATRRHVKAKMHQIRFRLGLCPDPSGGAYSTFPTTT